MHWATGRLNAQFGRCCAVGARNPRPRRRLQLLDVVRGLAILGMLLVDNPGIPQAYPRQLRHGNFDAFTAADVVFPLFLFVVGVAMPLSGRTADGRATPAPGVLLRLPGRGRAAAAVGVLAGAWAAFTYLPGPGGDAGTWAEGTTFSTAVDIAVGSEGIVRHLHAAVRCRVRGR
ncbi:MAG: hypothetical protein M3P91_06485 [Actinomycetota bacterium]|nr:hypothetical protein [Actinomycetota bacterium]